MDDYLPTSIIGVILVALIYSFLSLIAVWAGCYRRHWFLRFCALLIVLLPLFVFPSDEASYLFTNYYLSMMLVTTILISLRFATRVFKERSLQFIKFSIRDLLLAIVYISFPLGLLNWFQEEEPLSDLLDEVYILFYFSAIVTTVAWSALSSRHYILRLAGLLILPPLVSLPLYYFDQAFLGGCPVDC